MNKIQCKTKDYDDMVLHCHNPRCNYTWRYLGRFSFYATCPSCRRTSWLRDVVQGPSSPLLQYSYTLRASSAKSHDNS